MTRPDEPLDDPLDAAIDEAVARLTAVDVLDGPARARTLARLAAADEPRVRAWRPWAAWVAVPAMLCLFIALVTWIGRQPETITVTNRPTTLVTTPQRDPGRAAPEATEPARAAEPVQTTERGTGAERSTGSRPATASSTATTEASSRRSIVRASGRRLGAPTKGEEPDRLAAFLRAVQQLPPDVWERLDAAGPPVVQELGPGGPAPIAPIAVEELPGSEWSVADPVVPSPGESR